MQVQNQVSPLFRIVFLGAGIAIIAAAMNAAASTFSLVLISVLLAATLYPVPVYLTSKGMPRGPAIGLTALLAVVSGIGLIMVLGKSLSGLSANLPAYQSSLANLIDGVTEKLAARGMAVDEGLKPDPARIMGAVGRLAGVALSGLGYGLFCLVLVVLFLIELPLFKSDNAGPGSLRHRLDESMRLVRRYVGLNGLIGAVIALVNFFIMLIIGTDAPALWAVIAFLFAFVPFGFLISLVPPFIVTLLEQGPGRAGLLALIFFVVNFIGDNVIKPKVMGGGLGLSPLVIILSLMAWGVVLGPMGALLAIPLTITLKQILPVFTTATPSVPAA